MAYTKPKAFTSPLNAFSWPKVNEPDYGEKSPFPTPNGQYSVELKMDANAPETQAFVAMLQVQYDLALADADAKFAAMDNKSRARIGEIKANPFYSEVYDKETDEPTGELSFRFKLTASGTKKDGGRWATKPDLFDGTGTPMSRDIKIGTGTIGRVSFNCSPYFIPGSGMGGMALKLRAVQVVELVNENSGSADEYGFGDEGGFVAADVTPVPVPVEAGEADEVDGRDF